MKPRELLELIEEGESLTCEFKRKFSTTEKIVREMIAFANTKGGYLIIGVDDGKEVVVVEVFESQNKPHRIQDYLNELDVNKSVVTIRVNDKSVQASKEMIRILKSQSSELILKKYSIGSNEKAVFEFLDKYERITVKELSNYVNISERRASRTLVKLVRANLLFLHTKDNGEEFFTSAQ